LLAPSIPEKFSGSVTVACKVIIRICAISVTAPEPRNAIGVKLGLEPNAGRGYKSGRHEITKAKKETSGEA
jgi:hypothetical protein